MPPDLVAAEWAYRAWRDCVLNDPQASAYVHPDVILADPHMAGESPLVYVGGGPEIARKGFSSLAVLAAKTVYIHALSGLPDLLSLRGYRVLDDRLVGDNTAESLDAFVQSMVELARSGQAECILFQDLDVESPLRNAILKAGQRRDVSVWAPTDPNSHWWIRFPDPPDRYWQQFSKKTRYNFRYRAKRLEHTVSCIREPAQVAPFLEKAQSLSRNTWQYHRLKMAVNSDQESRQFWEQIASLGSMRSYLLEQNGQPLAYAIGLQWKGCFKFEKTGYDPAYAACSPGNVLLYRVLEDLIARDTPSLFDFGYGHSEYKEIFSNYQTQSGPLALVRRGLRPSTVITINRMHRWLGQNSRAVLRQLGVLRLLRRLYRR
ncbi:MAG: GNAT family N-acetyltransferase [Bacillota bacterium]